MELDSIAIINGKLLEGDLKSKLLDFAKQNDGNRVTDGSITDSETDREFLSRLLKEALKTNKTGGKSKRNAKTSNKDNTDGVGNDEPSDIKLPLRIISASFSDEEGFEVERLGAAKGPEPSIQ